MPPTYRTTNWPEYNAALMNRGSFLIWFGPESQWLAAPTGKRGRQPVVTDAAIQTCLTLKAVGPRSEWSDSANPSGATCRSRGLQSSRRSTLRVCRTNG